MAVGLAVALSLVGGSLLAAPDAAAQCIVGYDDEGYAIEGPAVMITGGTVTNETVIDITADAGTAISDASGGSFNLATTGGGGDGLDTASSGNGGVATASANGGAISIQDINSGGNVGNAISVGDTACAPYSPPAPAPAPEEPVYDVPVEEVIVSLPATGVGGFGDVSVLVSLLASAGAAAGALGLRRR